LKNIVDALKWWIRIVLPVVAIGLSIYSINISSVQFQLAQRAQELTIRHYYEIEEPALQYQRIYLNLIALDDKIKRAELWIDESKMPEDSIIELEQAVSTAEYYRLETEKALNENRLIDAEKFVGLANEHVDKVLRELSKITLTPPVVTVWCEEGLLSVGIDNLTTGRTREGKPLETITITMVDPPISSGYSYKVIDSYDISPDGAIFDNPVTFTFLYDADDIPFGCYEEDLVVATWDWDAEQWNILDDTRVNLQQNTISVRVDHLTYFAVLAQYPTPIQHIGCTSIVLGLVLSFILVYGIILASPKLRSLSILKRRQQGGRTLLTCKRCNHQWFPKVPTPKQCPKCHSRKWNE